MKMPQTICAELQVLELGSGSVAASLAGMMLADNGARVIKVEPPGGDSLRTGAPAGFLVWSRGKESALYDLRDAHSRATVRALAERADVVVAGVPPGRLERWGLAYEQLHSGNPGLIHSTITGFGTSGPYAKLKAYEGIVKAKLGVFNLGEFAFRDGPIFNGALTASTGAAHLALAGILAALIARERTGLGQRADTSLAQGLIPFDYYDIYHGQIAARAKETGAEVPGVAPGGELSASRYVLTLPTRDGRWVNVAPQLPHQAQALICGVGLDHTLTDPRFEHAPYFRTAEDAQAWEDMLWEKVRECTWPELEPGLSAQEDLPFELVRTSEEALEHPQMIANGLVAEIEDSTVGMVRAVGPVAVFERTPSVIGRSSPPLDTGGDAFVERAGLPAAPNGPEPGPHALSGITIIDFGYYYAMPCALTLAASLGARVIKIEGPNGDPMRVSFGAEAGAAKVMEGKESLSIDMKSPEGQAVVHRLVEDADAFVTSFRPQALERLEMSYKTLQSINPNIVYQHSAGYGVTGPFAHRPMYATIASAIVGNMPRHAGFWMDPAIWSDFSAREIQAVIAPRMYAPLDGDANAASGAFAALMLALFHQRRTGEGQFVVTSMLGGNAYAYSDDVVTYAGKPPPPASDPEQLGLSALYRLYRVADGWIFLAALGDDERAGLERALGEVLPDDDDKCAAHLSATFLVRSAEATEQELTAHGVGCAAVCGDDEFGVFAAKDPLLYDAGLTTDVEHPLFGQIRRHGLPVFLSATPGRIAPGCLRGEHTRSILEKLGFSEEEIADLEARNVVFGPE
jgi:crotonobetainyl-CoA:carnitine CoA-transferase CaiB-like acyl-CoA transferase